MKEKMRIVLEMHRGVWRRKRFPAEEFVRLWRIAVSKK